MADQWTAECYDIDEEIHWISPRGDRFRSRVDIGRVDGTIFEFCLRLSRGEQLPDWDFEIPPIWRGRPANRRIIKIWNSRIVGCVVVMELFYHGHFDRAFEAQLNRQLNPAPDEEDPNNGRQEARRDAHAAEVSDPGGSQQGRPQGHQEEQGLRFLRRIGAVRSPGSQQKERLSPASSEGD